MPKSSKRIILSTEKVNAFGFWIVTAGIDLANFLKNPIMYWMHEYPGDEKVKTGLPIGYWTDIKKIGNELSGIPVFDDNDDFAMKIYYKVEHGTIRAASVGINPIKLDTNKTNWKPAQKLPTFLTSVLEEVSIVDRGANSDAVALSNYGNNNIYATLKKNTNMETKIVNNDPADQDDEHTPATLAIFKNAFESGKFTKAEIDNLKRLTTNDPDILSATKDIIKKTPIKPENVQGKYHHTLITQAATKSYDQISSGGDTQLRNMKANAPELYKAKFFEKFGRMPADCV